jgi:hypothetical protein
MVTATAFPDYHTAKFHSMIEDFAKCGASLDSTRLTQYLEGTWFDTAYLRDMVGQQKTAEIPKRPKHRFLKLFSSKRDGVKG